MMRIRFANIICLIALSSNNRKPELRIRYCKAITKPDRTARTGEFGTAKPDRTAGTAKPQPQAGTVGPGRRARIADSEPQD